jgi:putative membrane protein
MIRPTEYPYRLWLLIVFLVMLGISAIKPDYPADFLLEHSMTAALLVFLLIVSRTQPMSNTAYTLMFGYLAIHVIGAHYTYSHVPYDQWSQWLLGTSISDIFGFERNHFDRLVHLLFGLLMLLPMRELVERYMRIDRVRLMIVAIAFIAVISKIYELIEWGYAEILSSDAAELYNGQQGDIYDAQKDMALALLGALITAAVAGVVSQTSSAHSCCLTIVRAQQSAKTLTALNGPGTGFWNPIDEPIA